jgi:hypothetical protein
MSRHVVTGLEQHHHIVVGWDPPLSTFFCQVFDRSEADGGEMPVLWLGAKFAEVPGIAKLKSALQPYCNIEEPLTLQLEADREAGR